MRRILLVDDDVELCELLREYLTAESFDVTCVHDGEAGVERARDAFDVVVLDVMMPRLNGFDALQRIRAESAVPILMLTARGDDIDRIVGLEAGADDYLGKPCNPRELVARIRAILRRTGTAMDPAGDAAASDILRQGDLVLDAGRRAVTCAGRAITVTGAEFTILEMLVRQPGEIVTKNTLIEVALARKPSAYDRSIDVHVSRIRKKLGEHPDGSPRIKAVRGAGYLYTAAPDGFGND